MALKTTDVESHSDTKHNTWHSRSSRENQAPGKPTVCCFQHIHCIQHSIDLDPTYHMESEA